MVNVITVISVRPDLSRRASPIFSHTLRRSGRASGGVKFRHAGSFVTPVKTGVHPFPRISSLPISFGWTRRAWDTQQILVNRSRRGKFSATPLWKRGARGDFFLPSGSTVAEDCRSAAKNPPLHHNQIPLNQLIVTHKFGIAESSSFPF